MSDRTPHFTELERKKIIDARELLIFVRDQFPAFYNISTDTDHIIGDIETLLGY